jgi:hypothetical protein
MTATMERPTPASSWNSMPGWGIVGDLTPPELINARRLQSLRRIIAAALGVVVLLCGAGFGYAMMQHSSAADDLDAAAAQTTQLTISVNRYSGITRIEGEVAAVNTQLATLMKTDVDAARLLTEIRAELPGSMSIDNISLAFIDPSVSVGAQSSSSSLDPSGHQRIGTVTITGSGRTLTDLAGFVDQVSAIRGVTDVVPTSNQQAKQVASFSLSLALTDQLYSHKFDYPQKGGK